MTTRATQSAVASDVPDAVRLRWFVRMLAAAVVGGGAGAITTELAVVAVVVLPFYVLWIASDIRVRGVAGTAAIVQMLCALVPGGVC